MNSTLEKQASEFCNIVDNLLNTYSVFDCEKEQLSEITSGLFCIVENEDAPKKLKVKALKLLSRVALDLDNAQLAYGLLQHALAINPKGTGFTKLLDKTANACAADILQSLDLILTTEALAIT